MKCNNCRFEVKEGERFCAKCGAAITNNAIRPAQAVNSAVPPKRKKSGNGVVVLIIALAVVLGMCLLAVIGCAAFVFYRINHTSSQKNYEDNDAFSVESTQSVVNQGTLNEENTHDDEYLFPSDSVYIIDSDLSGKTKEEVALIRNEIYARHGYIFKTQTYKEYFESKSWYVPNEYFSEAQFNAIEKENKDFIVEYEKKRGWR